MAKSGSPPDCSPDSRAERSGHRRRVLLVNDCMAGGGAERSMAVLANVLAEDGRHELSLLSIEDKWGYELHPAIRRLSLHRRYPLGAPQKVWTLLPDGLRLKRMVAGLGADTVLSFCYRSNFLNAVARACGAKHRCLVSERNYPLSYFEQYRFGWLARAMVRNLYNRADGVTCNGRDSERCLREQFGIARPITVIPNGYDPEAIRALAREPVDPADAALFDGRRRVVLYMAKMVRSKGHLDLLNAFAALRDPEHQILVLLGEGPLKAQLVHRIQELGVEGRVFLPGHKQNPYRYLARADVFAMPSYYEGYPNALAEALICRRACVAYDFKAGARDLLGDSEAGHLVPLGDVAALARAIDQAENRSDRARIFSLQDLRDAYLRLL